MMIETKSQNELVFGVHPIHSEKTNLNDTIRISSAAAAAAAVQSLMTSKIKRRASINSSVKAKNMQARSGRRKEHPTEVAWNIHARTQNWLQDKIIALKIYSMATPNVCQNTDWMNSSYTLNWHEYSVNVTCIRKQSQQR